MSAIVDAFTRIRRDRSDRILVYHPASGSHATAQQIWEAAVAFAEALASAGVGPGCVLLLSTGNHPATVATWIGCRLRGATLLATEPSATPAERDTLAARFGATAVVDWNDEPLAGFAHHAAGPFGSRLATRGAGWQPAADYRGAAILKLTSGSTGASKATFTTEEALVTDTSHIVEAMDIRADDCQLAVIPLSHAYAIGNVLLPLLLQGTACVLRDSFVPPQLMSDAATFAPRVMPGVPFMFDYFVQHPPAGGWPRSLQRLIAAGAPLSRDTVEVYRERFGTKIHTFYGTSETGGITFDETDGPIEPGYVGRPLPGVSVTLRDDEVAAPGTGRVFIQSDCVISRYVDGGDEGTLMEGGFLSGDIGALNDRGGLRLLGRVSAFLNVAGRKVAPDEVEVVLRSMPGIADARLIGLADPRRGERLVACLVAHGERPTALAVRRFCAERLAAHKIPRDVVWLDAIPLTDRGKTDGPRLRALAAAQDEAANDRML